jgi:hypothetical protein
VDEFEEGAFLMIKWSVHAFNKRQKARCKVLHMKIRLNDWIKIDYEITRSQVLQCHCVVFL